MTQLSGRRRRPKLGNWLLDLQASRQNDKEGSRKAGNRTSPTNLRVQVGTGAAGSHSETHPPRAAKRVPERVGGGDTGRAAWHTGLGPLSCCRNRHQHRRRQRIGRCSACGWTNKNRATGLTYHNDHKPSAKLGHANEPGASTGRTEEVNPAPPRSRLPPHTPTQVSKSASRLLKRGEPFGWPRWPAGGSCGGPRRLRGTCWSAAASGG